jgi:DNA invertase Pin-like site-specific DNA recombinase
MIFSAEDIATIRQRRANGESYAGIALDYGVHKNTIRKVAKEVPHGKIRYCRPSNFRAVGRDRRKAIVEMLRHAPMTTPQIRERLGCNPYYYLNELHKNGKIGHKCIWVIK